MNNIYELGSELLYLLVREMLHLCKLSNTSTRSRYFYGKRFLLLCNCDKPLFLLFWPFNSTNFLHLFPRINRRFSKSCFSWLIIILFGSILLFMGILVSIRRISAFIEPKVSEEQYFGKERGSRTNWTGQKAWRMMRKALAWPVVHVSMAMQVINWSQQSARPGV